MSFCCTYVIIVLGVFYIILNKNNPKAEDRLSRLLVTDSQVFVCMLCVCPFVYVCVLMSASVRESVRAFVGV